jgi:hypothetical protein
VGTFAFSSKVSEDWMNNHHIQIAEFLKRLGAYLTKLNKLTIFHTFIGNLNFCPLAWHFCGESNTEKLEKIQERALRFIYNDSDSSYENLLEKSQLPYQVLKII